MEKTDRFLEKNFRKLYWGLLAAAACVYFFLALDTSVWADEAYTFAMLGHSYREIWRITAADVHPPLYYFLLKLLTSPFGGKMLPVRLFSTVPYLLILAVGGWQGRRLFGVRTGLAFMLLFFLFPFGRGFAAEARMYSLAALFVFLNALFAYRCLISDGWKNWAGFAAAGVCAAYTHYFALVSVGILYGLLLIAILLRDRKRWTKWLLASAATVVLYLPWLKSFLSQLAYKVNNEYWIEPIGLNTVIGYFREVFGANGMATYFLFSGGLYLAVLVWILLRGEKRDRLVCLCALAVPAGTAAVGLLASVLVRPVFIARYLAPSAPLLVFFMAYALGRMERREIESAALTVLLMGGVSGLATQAVEVLRKPAGELDAGFVRQYETADAFLVSSGNTLHVSQVLSYYDPETPIFVPETLGADNPYPNRLPVSDFAPEDYATVVLLTEPGGSPDPWLAENYTAEYQGSVTQGDNTEDVWLLLQIEG